MCRLGSRFTDLALLAVSTVIVFCGAADEVPKISQQQFQYSSQIGTCPSEEGGKNSLEVTCCGQGQEGVTALIPGTKDGGLLSFMTIPQGVLNFQANVSSDRSNVDLFLFDPNADETGLKGKYLIHWRTGLVHDVTVTNDELQSPKLEGTYADMRISHSAWDYKVPYRQVVRIDGETTSPLLLQVFNKEATAAVAKLEYSYDAVFDCPSLSERESDLVKVGKWKDQQIAAVQRFEHPQATTKPTTLPAVDSVGTPAPTFSEHYLQVMNGAGSMQGDESTEATVKETEHKLVFKKHQKFKVPKIVFILFPVCLLVILAYKSRPCCPVTRDEPEELDQTPRLGEDDDMEMDCLEASSTVEAGLSRQFLTTPMWARRKTKDVREPKLDFRASSSSHQKFEQHEQHEQADETDEAPLLDSKNQETDRNRLLSVKALPGGDDDADENDLLWDGANSVSSDADHDHAAIEIKEKKQRIILHRKKSKQLERQESMSRNEWDNTLSRTRSVNRTATSSIHNGNLKKSKTVNTM